MTFGYLLDENYPPVMADVLRVRVPGIVVHVVGRPPAPPKQTADPDLLDYADANDLCLVTYDKETMPAWFEARGKAGLRATGLALFTRPAGHGKMADDLSCIVQVYDLDDMIDRIEYLPY